MAAMHTGALRRPSANPNGNSNECFRDQFPQDRSEPTRDPRSNLRSLSCRRLHPGGALPRQNKKPCGPVITNIDEKALERNEAGLFWGTTSRQVLSRPPPESA